MPTRGALAQALVQAGLAILDEEGAEGLTLRRIAARAGVSHAAPAHYFGGLPGLRQAIATRGFHDFQATLQEAASKPAASPKARLLRLAECYFDFADRHGGLFNLMFQEFESPCNGLRQAGMECYLLFSDCVAPLARDRDHCALGNAIWAMTHGYGVLRMASRADQSRPGLSFEALLDLLISPDRAAPA